jgi:hypothetical protein
MGTPTRLSVAAIATTAILTACATPYRPNSTWNQGGYSEQRREPGVYQVWFHGNHYTNEDRTEELAMLRGAELCLAENKPFMRAGVFQTSKELDVTTPGFVVYKSIPQAPVGGYGNPPSPVPTVVGGIPGGNRYNTMSGLTVECLAETNEGAMETTVVAATIRERYKINPKSAPRPPSG